jgi:glutaredoxin 2
MSELKREIAAAIDRANRENESDTPDFILAQFMLASLEAFEAMEARKYWFDKEKQTTFFIETDGGLLEGKI